MAIRRLDNDTYRVEVKYKGSWFFRKTLKDCTSDYANEVERAAIKSARAGMLKDSFIVPQQGLGGMYAACHLGALLRKKTQLSWAKASAGNTSIRNARLCITLLKDGYYTDVNSITRAMLNQLVLDIHAYKLKKTGKPISDATMNRYLAALSALVTLSEEEDILVVRRPKFPRFRESEGRQRVFLQSEQSEQYEYLRLYESPRLGALIRLAYETGARAGELRGINLRTDVIGKSWHIQRTAERNETKTFKTRVIPLTENAYNILVDMRNQYKTDEPFRRYTGSSLSRAFKKMREHLGYGEDKEYLFYTIRHTVATKLLASKVDIYTVSQMLGHSTVTTTMRYLKLIHMFREEFADAMVSINKG